MDPFLAEIRIFAGNFTPTGWAVCNGQLMPISQNTALFSLLGTYYGGDGRSTFGLPNLQGRVPIHAGAGPGLTPRSWGEFGGSDAVVLTPGQLPPHTHALQAASLPGTINNPSGAVLAASGNGGVIFNATPNAAMNAGSTGTAGLGQAHNNMQPYLVLNYIIALQGIFPARNSPQDSPRPATPDSPRPASPGGANHG